MPTFRASKRSRAASILWKRLDDPGHDACTVTQVANGWRINGVAVFLANRKPTHLTYNIACDEKWRTQTATIAGRYGDKELNATIQRSARGIWKLDGVVQHQLDACEDLDLAFTPATNTIALRRMRLRVGDAMNIRSAWLNIIDDEFSVLEQSYTRVTREHYRYFAPRFDFRARLTVNIHGIITNYPGLWKAE